jgi:membrane protein required for colicin V production
LNGFDYAIIGLAAIGFYMGFKRGLVMELALLTGLIAAIFGASLIADWLEVWLNQHTEIRGAWLPRISFVLALATIYTVAWFVGKSLSTAINLLMLGMINKLAGGVFSTIKYLLIVAVFLTLVAESGIGKIELLSASQSAGIMQRLGENLFPSIKQIGRNAVTLPEISIDSE